MTSTTTTLSTPLVSDLPKIESLRFGVVDYSVFILMLSASAGIGVYFGFFAKAKNTTEEYLRGGKKMQSLPIAISLVSSQLSGIAIMAVPAEVYTFGINTIFLVLAMIPILPFLIYVIVPVFYDNNVVNCYEYLERRFNKRTRQLITLTFIFNQFLMLPLYMFVPSLAFSQVTGYNIHLINTVVSSICVFYTMLGGIKAVVWTDVVQAGVIFVSVVLVAVLGTLRTGGLAQVLENASAGERLNFDLRLDPRIRLTVWNALISGFIMWTSKISLDQSCVQRIVSLPSYGHAKKSLIVAAIGFVVVMGLTAFAGIIMFAYYYGCDPLLAGLVNKPDKLVPFFIQDIMGHLAGMPGLFISCVFSASLSTLSAHLNSFAGVVYFDFLMPHIHHTEARANSIMKLIVFAMGAYCIFGCLIVERINSVLQTMMTITGINAGTVMGIFLLGMLVPRVNGKVAMFSILFSMTIMLWIIVNAQMNFTAGLVKYDALPTTIDHCEARGLDTIAAAINATGTRTILTTAAPIPANVTTAFGSNREFSVYDISFYWYKLLGATLVFAFSVPMSYIWRRDKGEKQDPKLYSPFVRKILNLEVEPEELPLKASLQKLDKEPATC